MATPNKSSWTVYCQPLGQEIRGVNANYMVLISVDILHFGTRVNFGVIASRYMTGIVHLRWHLMVISSVGCTQLLEFLVKETIIPNHKVGPTLPLTSRFHMQKKLWFFIMPSTAHSLEYWYKYNSLYLPRTPLPSSYQFPFPRKIHVPAWNECSITFSEENRRKKERKEKRRRKNFWIIMSPFVKILECWRFGWQKWWQKGGIRSNLSEELKSVSIG